MARKTKYETARRQRKERHAATIADAILGRYIQRLEEKVETLTKQVQELTNG